MVRALLPKAPQKCLPLTLVTEEDFSSWAKKQPARVGQYLKSDGFDGKPGSYSVLFDAQGKPVQALAGLSSPPSLWDIADLSSKLPPGTYQLDWDGPVAYHEWLALGWELGAYQFTRYKKSGKKFAMLAVSKKADFAKIKRYAEAIFLARDLINTTAEDLGPQELASAVVAVGKKYRAKVSQIVGNDLLKKNYPAVHRVGRASSRPPRLIDLTWGNPKHTKVTLVGKGVCFDTGGLDIKNSSGMYLMKKDMAGAACALAIGQMVMDAKLPVRLRVLIPAVENSISGNAYRPSDVIKMRNGKTVEVGNTDAEGRLILADALVEADREKPAMLLDFSTLTGAARVAVGAEISALFSSNKKLATDLIAHGEQMEDSLWELPLHESYRKMLDSPIADLNSAPGSPYAGAILAALFLQQFVSRSTPWAHLDFMGWNLSNKPGRPEGGEAMAVRAVYRLIEERAKRS